MVPFAFLLGGRKALASGTVKWFNAKKGHGFIKPDDGSADVFLRISEIENAELEHYEIKGDHILN